MESFNTLDCSSTDHSSAIVGSAVGEPSVKNLQNDLLQMYASSKYTDVDLQVKWKKTMTTLKTHKLVLSLRSPVFARQFYGKHPYSIVTFVVEGVSPRIMEIFLWYLYSDNIITESAEEIISFAKVARFYQIGGIVKRCKQKLSGFIPDINNVCSVLEAAIFFKMEQLRMKCMEIIQKNPRSIFISTEFKNADQEIVELVLKHSMKTITKGQSRDAVLRWLQHKTRADKSILSEFKIAALCVDKFLDLLHQYPGFVTPEEALSLLCNKLRPGMMSLPSWCDVCSNNTSTTPVEVTAAMIAERTLRLETNCNKQLCTASLFGRDGFKGSVMVQLKFNNHHKSPKRLQLVMLELAFGTNFVPEDALKLRIFAFSHTSTSIKKKKVKFFIQATQDNYYLILQENFDLQGNYPLLFSIQVEVKGLKLWRDDDQISNNQYRVINISENLYYHHQLKINQTACIFLSSLSDWLVFIEPATGKKCFLFTAVYFDGFFKS